MFQTKIFLSFKDSVIHKIRKCHRRLGKLLKMTEKSEENGDLTQSVVESKLIEIEKKVDKILENSLHSISMSTKSKKFSKSHEKKLFDVDINLNISTDGQSSVKATSSRVAKNDSNKS